MSVEHRRPQQHHRGRAARGTSTRQSGRWPGWIRSELAAEPRGEDAEARPGQAPVTEPKSGQMSAWMRAEQAGRLPRGWRPPETEATPIPMSESRREFATPLAEGPALEGSRACPRPTSAKDRQQASDRRREPSVRSKVSPDWPEAIGTPWSDRDRPLEQESESARRKAPRWSSYSLGVWLLDDHQEFPTDRREPREGPRTGSACAQQTLRRPSDRDPAQAPSRLAQVRLGAAEQARKQAEAMARASQRKALRRQASQQALQPAAMPRLKPTPQSQLLHDPPPQMPAAPPPSSAQTQTEPAAELPSSAAETAHPKPLQAQQQTQPHLQHQLQPADADGASLRHPPQVPRFHSSPSP